MALFTICNTVERDLGILKDVSRLVFIFGCAGADVGSHTGEGPRKGRRRLWGSRNTTFPQRGNEQIWKLSHGAAQGKGGRSVKAHTPLGGKRFKSGEGLSYRLR